LWGGSEQPVAVDAEANGGTGGGELEELST
jgi:hypothetical protein